MKIKRRDFLKGAVSSGILLASGGNKTAGASQKKSLPPNALGILYDSNLCIGCQVCVKACKEANNMPRDPAGTEGLWENPRDLSAKTLNVVKKYGTGGEKDEVGGYSFIKRHCMHCIDPACVSACPATALYKDENTGIVSYNKDACIGCRYCQISCPFNIPKFEWDSPFPKITKCQLCSHLIAKGGFSACCASCPTGASLFGEVYGLLQEARRRQHMEPGKYYEFPVARLGSGEFTRQRAKEYLPKIYGEDEVGGTQYLFLSGVPFDKLGMPDLPADSYIEDADGIQYAIYKGMVYPIVVLGGLLYMIRKGGDKH